MKHDNPVLVLALIRSFIWVVGAVWAAVAKRRLVFIGFTGAAVASAISGLVLSHYISSSQVVALNTAFSVIVASLIVGSFILGTRLYRQSHWKN